MCLVTHVCNMHPSGPIDLCASDASYYRNCPSSTQPICNMHVQLSNIQTVIINCSPKRVQRSCLVSNDSLVNSSLLKIWSIVPLNFLRKFNLTWIILVWVASKVNCGPIMPPISSSLLPTLLFAICLYISALPPQTYGNGATFSPFQSN